MSACLDPNEPVLPGLYSKHSVVEKESFFESPKQMALISSPAKIVGLFLDTYENSELQKGLETHIACSVVYAS